MNTRKALASKLEDAGMYEDEALAWIDDVIRAEALRLRCRCGMMALDESPGCTWHESRAESARDARKERGSVEW